MPGLTKRRFLHLTLQSLAAAGVAQEQPPSLVEGDTIHVPPVIEWEKIAELPPRHGLESQEGLAGVFAGVHDKVLIIAGGTNYPAGRPWTGARRAWWQDIYVLERIEGGAPDYVPAYTWVEPQAELKDAISCGASVSLPDGVLCLGGATLNVVHNRCFLMSWNRDARKVEFTEFPKLPRPLACHAAVLVRNVVYVLGGTHTMPSGPATASFYALDLARRGRPDFAWHALPPWQGPPRVYPIAAASMEGEAEAIYLCGGRNPGDAQDFLTDLHRFDPTRREWSILGDVIDPRDHPCAVMAAPAFHVPPHHLVVVGGTDAELLRLLESHSLERVESDDAEKAARAEFNHLLLEHYPGYPRAVLGYDAQIGEWNHIGHFPGRVCLANPAVVWDGQIIIPGGETGPGTRSNIIWMGTVRKKAAVLEE